ncbi:GNAT family N-acetyltransferase [Muriicola sp. Z0-33]|uniref:GNAT family N-acetyltransferase n=1 Tax=Muriicola sp. Z0-33 TaxID=2816957 RepID=UPI002237F6C4|nr:GNAT family N-acetyltransferase [Muriicola sp. Z0-33]MCW5516510.1 GNAT family N-acetyltransferase [Muriicola sp. Z0-33]
MIKVTRATEEQIDQLTPLFDAYRTFYKQPSDIVAARIYLLNRLMKKEATVFLAYENEIPIGFTLLYATFSSVSMAPVFILNDLYVSENARNKGVGEALLNRAKAHCKEMGYKGLALETAIDNPAQQLYERLDWKRDSHCFHYFWKAD